MSKKRTLIGLLIVIIAVGLLVQGRVTVASDAAGELEKAMGTMGDFGRFTFHSDLIQTETFAPRVENVGRTDNVQRMSIDGEIDNATDFSRLNLTSSNGQTAALKYEDGVAYEQQADGSWVVSEQAHNPITTGGNPITFLEIATNVRNAENSDLFPDELLPSQTNITRLAFDLDRTQFQQFLRTQLIDQLEAKGEYRAGINYSIGDAYDQMDGVGELWLDADGNPVRQIVKANLPQADGNVIDVRVTTTFNEWTVEEGIQYSVFSIQSVRDLVPNTEYRIPVTEFGIAFTALWLAGALLLFGRSRRLYIALAALLIVSMAGTPLFNLVHAASNHAFMDSLQAQHRGEAETTPPTDHPTLERNFAPNLDPLLLEQAAAQAAVVPTTRNSTAFQSGTDTDGDTINDEDEIYRLGSNPNGIDTDNDTISDNYEVAGFTINGKTWYLDPLKVDSNGDGLPDNIECIDRVNVGIDGNFHSDANPLTNCPDTDGDNVPDVWDFDNDGDGVPDSQDTSPNYAGDGVTHDAGGFKFDLAGLNVDKPVEIAFQVAPIDPEHFYIANNVYDWPSGDTNGQFRRVRDTTLSSVGVTGDAARNGDVIIIPELEITIPWDAANPTRGLPISATVPITKGTPLESFVDFSLLKHSKASAYRDETTGAVYLYLSLAEIQDSIGDRPVAWRGHMPYLPKLATGNGDHTVRLAWSTIGLFDNCDPSKVPAGVSAATFCAPTNLANWESQMQLMHRYYEPFKLTGFSIEENGGINTAIIADKTALTSSYATNLWHVSNGLMETFLRPTTLADSSRFGVNEIVRRFQSGSSATATERWGLANNALAVQQHTNANHTVATNALAKNQPIDFLQSTYGATTDGKRVTIAFAQDVTSRALQMGNGLPSEIGYSAANKRLSVDLSSAETQTYSSLTWRPFKYSTAKGWEAELDLDAHITQLKTDVTPLLTNSVLDTLFTGTISNYADARAGALAMTAAHYTTLFVGLNVGTNYDGDILNGVPQNDTAYQLALNPQPLFDIVSDAGNFLYSAALEVTVLNLDGQTISLSGYAPPPDLATFMTAYGEYVNAQDSLTDNTFSMRRGAVKFIVGTVVYLYQVATRQYDLSNTSSGLRYQSFYAVGMLMGAALLITVFVESQKGTLSPVGQKVMTILANTLFIASQPLEVMRIAKLAGHLKAAKLGFTVAKSIANATQRAAMIARSFAVVRVVVKLTKMIAALGLGLDILIEVVFFLYTIISNKFKPGDVGFHVALARFVSAVAVAFVFAIATFTAFAFILLSNPAGWAILAVLILLAVIDSVLAIICAETKADSQSFLCNGVTGGVVNEMTKFFFKHTPLVQLNHSDRVRLDRSPMQLANPEKGFTLGNEIQTTFYITHTLYPESLDGYWTFDKPSDAKIGRFSDIWTRRSSVAYFMSPDANRIFTNTLVVTDQPQSAWNVVTTGSYPFTEGLPGVPARADYVVDYHLQQSFEIATTRALTATGLNKAFSYYLTENVAIPLANCHNLLVGYGCELKNHPDDTRFSTKIPMADLYVFDVLPANVSGFGALTPVPKAAGQIGYRQVWESTFPVLHDADGDGLLSVWYGGADPNDSSADTDNDGLLDAYELRNGFDPQRADGDADGLTDYWEVFHKTNPFSADTDSDGLLDGEEMFHPAAYAGSPLNTAASWTGGWEVVYQYSSGTPQLTRVSANPVTIDSDGDGNSDRYEFIYKFNPRAPYSVDPIEIESAGNSVNDAYEFVAKPGVDLNYNVTVKSNLDTILRSRGLVEAELPIDTVQQTQAFSLLGQSSLNMTGTLTIDPAVYTTTTATEFVLRAGAHTNDANYTPPAPQVAQHLPLTQLAASGDPAQTNFRYTYDRSGNGRTALCTLGTGFNGCADFSQGYATFANDDYFTNNVPLSGDAAVSIWVKPDTIADAADQPIVRHERREIVNFAEEIKPVLEIGKAAANTIYAKLYQGANCASVIESRLNSTVGLTNDQWNHVVFNYDGTTATLYVNGQASGAVSFTPCGDTERGAIGANIGGATTFVGGMRDMTQYDRSLTVTEIEREAASGYRALELRLDEPPASEAFYDTRTANVAGQCSIAISGLLPRCPQTGRPAISNQALLFPTATSAAYQIELNSTAAQVGIDDNASFTVMGWVNGADWSGQRKVVALSESRLAHYKAQFGVVDGHPTMGYSSYPNGPYTLTEFTATGTTLQTNRWYHLAWQVDRQANVVRLFVDGVQVSEQAAAGFAAPGAYKLYLGGHGYWVQTDPSFKNFEGMFDHLVVLSRVVNSAEITKIINESPIVNLHLDEDFGTGSFANSSTANVTATCTSCPATGARGQMREAPIFTGTNTIALSGTPALTDKTVSFWVRPEINKSAAQTLLRDSSFVVGLSADNKLQYCTGSGQYTTNAALLNNAWTHIAIVRNNNVPTLFINGVPQTTPPATSLVCPTGTTQIGGSFDGRIDEFAIYDTPLLALEIKNQYDYQSRWFDVKLQPSLLIDGEGPKIDLHVPPYLSAASGQKILFEINDAGVGLGRIFTEIRVVGANSGSTLPYTNTSGYIADLSGVTLQANTSYRVQIDVRDHLGNITVVEKVFQVDAAAPVATLTTGSSIIPTTNALTLNGTISDALSGVVTDTVSVAVFKGGVQRAETVRATVTGNQWQAVIPFDVAPYGTYAVHIGAQDAVGNALYSHVGNVQLEGSDPSAGVLLTTDVISSSNATIHGFASNIPYPLAPLVLLPFDETAGTKFADAAPFNRMPTCTSCPTVGATGVNGKAATFAVGNHLQYTDTLTSSIGTLAMWLQPTWSTNENGFAPIVATSGQTQLRIADNLQSITIGAHNVPFSLSTNQWVHLALLNDGSNIRVYRNGVQTAILTDTLSTGLPLTIGAAAQGFSGLLDDVIVVNDTLTPEAIYDLTNTIGGGISKVEVSLWHPTTVNPTWKTATLDSTSSKYTNWTYNVTEQIEGPYRINLRVTNSHGHTRTIGSNWTGTIDTVPPRVALSASNVGNGQISVSCSADDLLLNTASWQCSIPDAPASVYQTASWYTRHISPSQQVIQYSSSGTLPTQNVSVTACDSVGQCTTDTVDMLGNLQISGVPEIGDYQLVYKLTPPAANAYTNPITYDIDNAAQIGAFDRVAYWVELENGSERQWVYVSMDAFTNNAAATGVPIANTFEQNVTNLNVLSNVPGITTGGPFASGNIEFWPDSYAETANSGLGGDSATFDFDDQPAGTCCYGAMQVHRANVQQTLFAWNRWSANSGNDDIGIGKQGTGNPDWTYAQNSGSWTTRTLYVLVRPNSAATNDSYNFTPGVPLTVNAASGVLANDANNVTATLVTQPANGSVALNADGSFTYSGAAATTQSFTYRISDGHYLSKTATVTLNPSTSSTCFVETTGDGITDAHSADASALQNAVAAATAGSTIKIAGTCADSTLVEGALLTINKELTLQGGYEAGRWLETSNPSGIKATLDATPANVNVNSGVVLIVGSNGRVTASGLTIRGASITYDYDSGGASTSFKAPIENAGHLQLSDTLITTNNMLKSVGGVYNSGVMTATQIAVSDNTGLHNGGIFNRGKLLLTHSHISGNLGGGFYNDSDRDPANPAVAHLSDVVIRNHTIRGGIHNREVSHLTLERVAIINNEANNNAAGISNRGFLTMTNSTVSSNRNLTSGLFHLPPYSAASGMLNLAVATIKHSTIVSNTSPNTPYLNGFQYEYYDPPQAGVYETNMEGVVIAYNGSNDCSGFHWEPGFVRNTSFAVGGTNNYASDATCTGTNFTTGDPLLAPLPDPASNSLAIQAHVPQTGSPLIDAASSCGLAADQRGVTRDALCDIGAIDMSSATAQTACPNAAATLTNATHNATLQIPTGAVTACQEITFAPRAITSGSVPGDWQFVGNSFLLNAWQNDLMLLNPSFAQPLQLTLGYTNAQIGSLTESDLVLYTYDTANRRWVDAATTCSPASSYVRDAVNNTLTVNICHFTEFVLASKPPAPHTFTGSVQFDGAAAADGTVVKAIVTNGTNSAEYTTTTSGGKYGLTVSADNLGTAAYDGGVNGNTITFLVRDFQATQTATFNNGSIDTLNLTAVTNLVVSSLADSTDGNFTTGHNTLREALANAKNGDTITFDASIANGTITVGSIFDIAKHVTISASVPITLSGGNASGIVQIGNGHTVTLHGLTLANGRASIGGAVHAYNGTLILENSTVIGNTSTDGGYFGVGGGAIFISVNTNAVIRNSTFSGNTATKTGGGAIWNWGHMTIENSTFSDNIAPAGGALWNAGQSMTLKNSILANSVTDASSATTDCQSGSAIVGSHNLIESDTVGQYACGTTNTVFGADPALAPLANNGGNTQTQLPTPSSPAIDTGDNSTCLSHDQRGITRPQHGTCEIGAVEIESVCKDVAVVAGWNIVSLPVPLADMSVATNFPHATSSAFSYQGGYSTATTLTIGKGYWLKFDAPRTYNFCGTPSTETRIPVTAGWNIIAPYHNAMAVSSLSTVNTISNQITTNFFHYSGGYGVATALQPGGGYWVKVDANGFLQWSSARTTQHAPQTECAIVASLALTTTDGSQTNNLLLGTSPSATDGLDAACGEFELPPAAPGGLESRFVVPSGEQVWIDIRSTPTQQWELRLDNATVDTTLTWDATTLNGQTATLHYFSSGQAHSILLNGAGSHTLPADVSGATVMLASVPTAVGLQQMSASGISIGWTLAVWVGLMVGSLWIGRKRVW